MASIINFSEKRANLEKQENIKLKDWVIGKSDEELRTVFLRLDSTMQYIHDKGYCIKTFNPNEIELIEGLTNKIKYNVLLEMPKNIITQNELVKEDIYNSSYLQIGIYTKCLDKMNPRFLKDNFDSFATFLPEGDVPYYKGVIERGASVYFNVYNKERKTRDYAQLEGQVEDTGVKRGRALVKSNGLFQGETEDKINNQIYKQLDNKEAAFVSFLIFPTIVLFLGLMVTIIAWIASLS